MYGYCNLQNFSPKTCFISIYGIAINKILVYLGKISNANMYNVFDTNFLRVLEFLKTLKLCFERDWESFFCINLILMYVKCSLFDFLFAFKNLYCVATTEDVSMGETVKFVSGSSSIANLGLFWKLKIQCKYWWLNSNRICKCKPTIDCSEIPVKIT